MYRFITRTLALALGASLSLTACADNDAATPDNNGWQLGDNSSAADMGAADDGGDSLDASLPGNNTNANNASMLEDMGDVDMGTPPTDMGTTPTDMEPAPADMEPAPADMGPAPVDMEPAPADMGPAPTDMGTSGGSMEGDGCATTSECAGGLVCCAGLNGQFSCTAENQCFTGGVCQTNTECPGQQECCDLSQLGLQQKVCRDQCMADPGCQNNNECSTGEVCCLSLSGAPACTLAGQCQTGGRCAQDMDCLGGQVCCGFGDFKVCLDQCGF